MSTKNVLVYLVCLSFTAVFVSAISYEEDVTLTAEEKKALDKFKILVIPNIPKSSYLQNYVKDDLYFIHWLRAKHLNIPAAEEMFLKHLKWRETERMDSVTDDSFDWDQFHKEYPLYFNGTVDKEGRPVGEIWFGAWNLRKGVLGGMSKQLIRSVARFYEMMSRRLYKARAEGQKVSQVVILDDIDGFNLRQHACASCLPVILSVVTLFENHYPYLLDTIFLINMPPAFQVILRLVHPVLREQTANAIRTYSDRKIWTVALDEKIEKSQRSVRLGGTIIRDRE